MDTLNKDSFMECYHIPYPTNIKFMRLQIKGLSKDNKHASAMLHFLNCLEENESGMVYGMLTSALNKYIEENTNYNMSDY